MRSVSLALLAALVPAVAGASESETIGGIGLTCLNPNERSDFEGEFKDFEKVLFDGGQTKKILAVINAKPPVTTLAADDMVVWRDARVALLTFDIGEKFCVAGPPIPVEYFNPIVDEALGKQG